MKYALLIYSNGGEFQNLTEDQQKAVYDEYMQVSNSPGIVGGSSSGTSSIRSWPLIVFRS